MLMAGVAPVEGTSIIAREMRDTLLREGWSAQELDAAAAFLYDPGISVLEMAKVAVETGYVTAMHDPTEGGVATGLAEIAIAAGCGHGNRPGRNADSGLSLRLCRHFGLDPLGVIASGALLATTEPEVCGGTSRSNGTPEAGPAAIIGRITDDSELTAIAQWETCKSSRALLSMKLPNCGG